MARKARRGAQTGPYSLYPFPLRVPHSGDIAESYKSSRCHNCKSGT